MGSDLIGCFHGPPGDRSHPGGWWLLFEPELHFGDDVVVPDQAGWRQERMPKVPNVAAFTLAPDWACEVISPSTGKVDRSRKMRIYAREGVGHLWLVDPFLRTVEVYRLRDGSWQVAAVHGGDAPARLAPFDAVELAVGRWWMEGV
jgi:Uma2 family endonuclease